MATLLVALAIMSVLLTMALPAWRHAARREAEAELVFRGEQYARAVALFQRKFAAAYPPSIELLLEQRFLRKAYRDPMVEDGEFRILYQTSAPAAGSGSGVGAVPGAAAGGVQEPPRAPPSVDEGGTVVGPRGGIMGVASRSEEQSIRLYNGRDRYSDWQFVYAPTTAQPGAPGAGTPGQPVSPDGSSPPGGLFGPTRPGLPPGGGQRDGGSRPGPPPTFGPISPGPVR